MFHVKHPLTRKLNIMTKRTAQESRDLLKTTISDKENEVENNIQQQRYDQGFVAGMKRAFEILKGDD